MDHISYSHHIPQNPSGSSGQYTFHEQGMHGQDLIHSRDVELSSDLNSAVLEQQTSELSRQRFSNSSEGMVHLPSSEAMMMNSMRAGNEVTRSNRRFTIGTPVQTTEFISQLTEDRTAESSAMTDPINNFWRRTYQSTPVPVRGLLDGSTWEQSLTNDSIRPFTSPGYLGTVQNEDWSTASMKTFTNNESERVQHTKLELTNTANDLAFFEHLTSTDITDDLREISPEFSYDALHRQGSSVPTDETVKTSTDSNTLLCSTKGTKKTSTPTKSVRKTKKEKDPNRLADRRKRRRESHNAVERRRRDLINDRIAELAMLLPKDDLMDAIAHSASGGTMPHINLKPFLPQRQDLLQDNLFIDGHQLEAIAQSKPNKGIILTKAVEYIRYLRNACAILRQDNERLQAGGRFDNQHL